VRCCASTFLRRPSTERALSTIVHCEFIVARNLKLIQSSLVWCCCLRNLLGLLGWGQILPGSGSFLMTQSKQALMRVTWNLMWSYPSSLSINVILLVYKCDLALPISVMREYVCDVSLLWWLPYPGWFQDVAPDGCQILAGSGMPPSSGQVTIGVAYVSLTGIN
jgi:hypothetical protein